VAVKRRLADADHLTRGDDRIGTSDLVSLLRGARWDGMIRARQGVVARAHREGHRLVIFGEIETGPTQVGSVQVFTDEQWT
jgi:hypothetical protein